MLQLKKRENLRKEIKLFRKTAISQKTNKKQRPSDNHSGAALFT